MYSSPTKHIFEMNPPNLLILPAALILLLFAQVLFASGPIDPDAACNFLKQERFRGSMEYGQKKSGIYNCISLRKSVNKGEPTGSDIRYEVRGEDTQVTILLLHLRMRSHRLSVPVLKEFHHYANIIYKKIFLDQLPEEITKAIIAAVKGEWAVQGHKVSLNRLHDKALTYELIFSIEK